MASAGWPKHGYRSPKIVHGEYYGVGVGWATGRLVVEDVGDLVKAVTSH